MTKTRRAGGAPSECSAAARHVKLALDPNGCPKWPTHGRETAKSYQPQDATSHERAIMQPLDYIPPEHLDWLEARPLYHETDRYIFVHASLRPAAH